MDSTTGGFFQTSSLHVLAQTAVSSPHFLPPALLSCFCSNSDPSSLILHCPSL